jgi:hypothetical protein
LEGLWLQVSSSKKVYETPYQLTAGHGGVYLSSQGMHKIGRFHPRSAWQKNETISNITTAKSAGDMVQRVEHLSSKHEALSSNHRTMTKKTPNLNRL